METLISKNLPIFSNSLIFAIRPSSRFLSFAANNRIFFRSGFHKRSWNHRHPIFSTISAPCVSSHSSYGGWDDLELLNDNIFSGRLDSLQSFLASVGIHDKRHAFLFCLGFFSALAVSRVRFSTVVIFPVAVLVFVVGLSMGVAQGDAVGGSFRQTDRNQTSVRYFDEKLKKMRDFFDELDIKMSNLKRDFEENVATNHVEVGEMKRYIDTIESLRSAITPVKRSVEDSMNWDSSDGSEGSNQEIERKLNQKSGRKKKDMSVIGSESIQFLVGLLKESLIGSKTSKTKDSVKREPTEQNNQIRADATQENAVVDESKVLNSPSYNNLENIKIDYFQRENFDNKTKSSEPLFEERKSTPPVFNSVKSELNKKIPVISGASVTNEKQFNCKDGIYDNGVLHYNEELDDLNRSFHFTSRQGRFQKIVLQHLKSEVQTLENLCNSAESGKNLTRQESEIDSFTAEAESSLQFKQTVNIHERAYMSPPDRRNAKRDVKQGIQNVANKGEALKFEDQVSGNKQYVNDVEEGNIFSSSVTSADEEFNRNLKEAMDLLKQARECLKGQADEETAEKILYNSATLLSTAVAMKPMSLLAVGQLGNTFLLHGELKLKISRELRTLLSRSDSLFVRKRHGTKFEGLSSHVLSKEKVASVLVDVCEECEELLVEAGRKYRMALSIDGNDVRALYNWGLALSLRAQLIADIGPKAAFDADKVYLAAIDKFDAMLSKNNVYASDALYRWGIILQQRSRLRPNSSREKVKLLQQAKSLFEDVLRVDSDNPNVRDALFSCTSQLNLNGALQ